MASTDCLLMLPTFGCYTRQDSLFFLFLFCYCLFCVVCFLTTIPNLEPNLTAVSLDRATLCEMFKKSEKLGCKCKGAYIYRRLCFKQKSSVGHASFTLSYNLLPYLFLDK